jgi:elongation factor G
MKQYSPRQIRNVVLLSHSGAGKTTLSESILFASGAISRLGKVEAGTTTSDYDPDEIKHRISINLGLLPCEWKDHKINLLDAPGYADFVGEVKSAVRISDGAVIVVGAASGLEVGTDMTWNYAREAGVARLFFINKMDRENANFNKVVEQIQGKYGTKCLPVQLPVGAHTDFKGVIDLLTMKAYIGLPAQETVIPADLVQQATELRARMVETIAETDDILMEKYLGGEELSADVGHDRRTNPHPGWLRFAGNRRQGAAGCRR